MSNQPFPHWPVVAIILGVALFIAIAVIWLLDYENHRLAKQLKKTLHDTETCASRAGIISRKLSEVSIRCGKAHSTLAHCATSIGLERNMKLVSEAFHVLDFVGRIAEYQEVRCKECGTLHAVRTDGKVMALARDAESLKKHAEFIRYYDGDISKLSLELEAFLDDQDVTSENIGEIRASLLLTESSRWNEMVRDMTAEAENKIS